MNVYEIIKRKRDGNQLTYQELKYLIDGYTADTVPDYQFSAFLMAVYFKGMTSQETHFLTKAMVESSEEIDLSSIPGIKVDKHSSGGVADTVTLVAAPIAAAGGVLMPKMSGRGLGHTGGTIDKLESIPGFNTLLTMEQFLKNIKEVGMAVTAQSQELVPADKKIYALRDVTATVDSIPLIAASIMSKKLASGADAILLDVKTGSGAFMKEPEEAKELAKLMVEIGKQAGKKMLAFVTDMNQPLGVAVGNSLEVEEAISILTGNGIERLHKLCIKVAGGMLWLGGKAISLEQGEEYAQKLVDEEKALAKFKEFIEAQGGNSAVCDDLTLLPHAKIQKDFIAQTDGFLDKIDTEAVGFASVKLGAGRVIKDAPIDHSAGIIVYKSLGDPIKSGEKICTLFAASEEKINFALENLTEAFTITKKPPLLKPLIYDILT